MAAAALLHGVGNDSHRALDRASGNNRESLSHSRTDELSGSSIIFRGNVVARRAKNHYFLHIRT